jgi:hypothetical protein
VSLAYTDDNSAVLLLSREEREHPYGLAEAKALDPIARHFGAPLKRLSPIASILS